MIGENWLNKIGIAILVIGIGFFVKYAIDQNWIGEVGRVAIGIGTGAADLKTRAPKQYAVYKILCSQDSIKDILSLKNIVSNPLQICLALQKKGSMI